MVIDSNTATKLTRMKVASEALNYCQKSLFNAGDDFVALVMNYVGAEDELLAKIKRRAADCLITDRTQA
jgi:hypothetical protein